ncbi:hypothetical protein [Nostocoides vanveenii]|uniref:hypothetical protein n=1 Tax=Nostocoides vanveenii TaxID=330835 RepID=UPI0031D5DF2C
MAGVESSQVISALTRRTFLGGTAAIGGLGAIPAAAEALDVAAGSAHWLGDRFWGNRLQDWLVRAGRMECVAATGSTVGRTIAVLTHEIQGMSFDLSVRTGTVTLGNGLSGFVVGTGIPGEDARRRALLGSASGIGGGLIAAVDQGGAVGFRDHTAEGDQFLWQQLPASVVGAAQPRTASEDLTLRLTCRPVSADAVTLSLSVAATASGEVRQRATLASVPWARVRGGIALISSSRDGSEARYWLTGFTASGVTVIPNRALGPVVGTLFTAVGGTLRMTVQLMPLDPRTLPGLSLEVQRAGVWTRLGTSTIGPGYTALFYAKGIDTSAPTGYRIVGSGQVLYGGTIPAAPRAGLRVASLNCLKASHRPLDSVTPWQARLPGSVALDLYSKRNIYFPHNEIMASIAAQRPDLLVAHGDQLYETSPTAKDKGPAPELDFLYKFLLWHWAMRPLTQRLPTIVLTDDHDVYQPNLFGEGGIATTDPKTGGYVNAASWVNLVQRMSSWHNPDRFDPRPVAQGITVGYAAFAYGGTSFAIVEDRKFKNGPVAPGGGALELLGARQETFLSTWAGMHAGMPKVILTGSTWACVLTNANGAPRADPDTHGWPPEGRARAVRLAQAAHALIVAGDQHVGHLVRHGIAGFADGPLQFTPPAGSSSFQRWFAPAAALPNPGDTPNTGDFTDAFGNRVRVLAVANPKFTLKELWQYYPPPSQDFGDRGLKREGFGLLVFDHDAKTVRIECWPWHTAESGAEQYAGWPVTVPYSAL